MKCLVLSFLMGYNNHVYREGEYVEVKDGDVERLIKERCVSKLPYEEPKKAEEKPEEEKPVKTTPVKSGVKHVKRGVKKANDTNNKL